MKKEIIIILSLINLIFFLYFIYNEPINFEWISTLFMTITVVIFIISNYFNKYNIIYFIHKYIFQPYFYVFSLLLNNKLLILHSLLSLVTVIFTWSYFNFCIIDYVSLKFIYKIPPIEYYIQALSIIILFFKLLNIECYFVNIIIFLIQLFIYLVFLYYNLKYPDKYLSKMNSIPIIINM